MYDLLITNGRMIDGTGSAPYRVDVVATFEAPHSYPTGVAHVAVNGVLAVEHGACILGARLARRFVVLPTERWRCSSPQLSL